MAVYKCGAQTRDQILSTASRLFYEKGYQETTVRDICHACGLSVSRINYHFQSKADLAGEVCRAFLCNFYNEAEQVINTRRGYSLITETIVMRFLVEMLMGATEDLNYARFYREIAQEGILANVFSEMDNQFVSAALSSDRYSSPEKLRSRIGIYNRIYSAALGTMIGGWKQILADHRNDRDQALELLQDVLSELFLQMLDLPHDDQERILQMSRAYYGLMTVETNGLTDVQITLRRELSYEDKVQILGPIYARLYAEPDRR